MTDRMDLKAFFHILKKRFLSIILTVIFVFSCTFLIVTYVMQPTYQASESLLVGLFKNKDSQETQEITRIVTSTSDFIKSPVVLREVEKQLKTENIAEEIVVKNNFNSQIINIVVRNSDPDFAKQLAHTVAIVTLEKMNELLKGDDITLLSSLDEGSSLERVDKPVMSLAIGLMVGFFTSIGLAMTLEYLDDGIDSVKEIEMNLGLTVLGEVNLKGRKKLNGKLLNQGKRKHRKGFENIKLCEELISSEQIRMIRTNLYNAQKNFSLMMITSPNLSEQKSIISAKLAISMAEIGKRVLLVDAKLQKPSLHEWFNTDNKSGLTNVVLKKESLLVHFNVTHASGLSLLTTGPTHFETAEIWASQELKKAINEWRVKYDLVIFDSPSFLEASDAQILAQYCDEIVLVLKKNSTKKEDIVKTKKYLGISNKNILGVIYQVK